MNSFTTNILFCIALPLLASSSSLRNDDCGQFKSADEFRKWANAAVEPSGLGFTDKFMWHGYAHPYFKYMNDLRCTKPKMLEIGLGIPPRAGASIYFWRQFFGKKAEIHLLEYEQKNADAFHDKFPTVADKIFIGDQGDDAVLQRVISDGGGNYDIIVDDGSHWTTHQVKFVKHFLPHVKPGGLLVIEDVHTFYSVEHQGNPRGRNGHVHSPFLRLIRELVEDQFMLAVKADCDPSTLYHPELSPMIGSVDVMRELVVITRYKPDSWDDEYGACVGTRNCACGKEGGDKCIV